MSNYVNNKKLYEVMKEYHAEVKAAEASGAEPPRIPEYVGECFLLIATRLSSKLNFIGYTYKDEMVSDGIENCILYINNFNPEKSKNPFSYFTTVVYNAFLRRIEKEKKQTYLKHKNYVKHVMSDVLSSPHMVDTLKSDDVSFELIDKYEKTMNERKRLTKKRKNVSMQNTVSKFLTSKESEGQNNE